MVEGQGRASRMKRIEDDDLPSSDFRLRLTPARRAGKAGEDDFSPMGGALGCTGRKPVRRCGNIGVFQHSTRKPLAIVSCFWGGEERICENTEVFENTSGAQVVNYP